MHSHDRAAEIAWGVRQEAEIAALWIAKTGLKVAVAPSPIDNTDFDFLLVRAPTGLLIGYVEVKARRISILKHDTSIWPARKHELAKRLAADNVPLVGVVRYTDALLEVPLWETPEWSGMIERQDRGTKVEHVAFKHNAGKVWWL